MGEITFFTDIFEQSYSMGDLCLMVSVVLFFLIQLYFYAIYYGRVARYKSKPIKGDVARVEPISVVVIMREDAEWVEQTLPLLLTQEYESFEIVVVDMGMNADLTDIIRSMSMVYPHLITTRFKYDPKFPISNKMAYNVGIKAAHNPNIILTTVNARPVSEHWLKAMGNAFSRAEVVLGYCGVEIHAGGFVQRMMRCSDLAASVRFAAAAIDGKPYRGSINNFGFKRQLYFDHKGFNHLNMNIGEDDLFVSRIATADNCAVVLDTDSRVVETIYGGCKSWASERRFHDYAKTLYPMHIKFTTTFELASRVMFWVSVVAAMVITPWILGAVALFLLLVRIAVVWIVMRKICRKLGEGRLLSVYPLYDLMSPIGAVRNFILRRIAPPQGIWR